jgi:hypothetical protein
MPLATLGTQERFRVLSFDSVFFLADQKENELGFGVITPLILRTSHYNL